MINAHNIKTDFSSTHSIVKRYRQYSKGTAYFKVAGQLLELIHEGAKAITIIFEGNPKWEQYYRNQIELVSKSHPDVQISFITEYQ